MRSRLRALYTLLMIIVMKMATSLPPSGAAQVKDRRGKKKHPRQRTPKGAGVTTTRTPLKGQCLIWSTSDTTPKQIDNNRLTNSSV